jgi:hypothetical protein
MAPLSGILHASTLGIQYQALTRRALHPHAHIDLVRAATSGMIRSHDILDDVLDDVLVLRCDRKAPLGNIACPAICWLPSQTQFCKPVIVGINVQSVQ